MDAPDGIDLDGNVDMERDCDDDEKEAEEVEDEEKEDEEEDKDEDDGKEPRTIGQGAMIYTSADDADTIVDDERTVIPEHGQETEQGQQMLEHTPWSEPLAPALRPQTQETPPPPRTPKTDTLSWVELLRPMTPQKPRPAASTLREGEAPGHTLYVDVEQQLLGESAGGNSLPGVPLPGVPLPDVPLPDVPLPDVPLGEARPDGSVGEE